MTNQSEGSAVEKAKAEMLSAEELAELERLRTEVDRLTGQFEDGGYKNMGVAQQLSYAEDRLGQAMVDKRSPPPRHGVPAGRARIGAGVFG